ncbi:MAG TPA: oxidoreductase, partial [Vicinamibacteria bacterium]
MAGNRRSSTRKLPAGPEAQAVLENGPGPEELRQALAVLEAVVSDRAILAQLPNEERTRLLVAAGRTVHPDLQQKRRLVRSLRTAERRRAEARDRAVLAQTGIRSARQAEVFVAPPKALEAGEPEVVREVATPKKCYVCKAEYRLVHSFYDALCPPCAELNYDKRFQTADLRGKVALVTGARVKIGYQAALKLLRAGAQVVATTRFPHDAARRYA